MIKMEDILKPGKKLEAFIIDPDSERFKNLIEETHKSQEAILALKRIDMAELRNTFITI
jgi:hypothetical protein